MRDDHFGSTSAQEYRKQFGSCNTWEYQKRENKDGKQVFAVVCGEANKNIVLSTNFAATYKGYAKDYPVKNCSEFVQNAVDGSLSTVMTNVVPVGGFGEGSHRAAFGFVHRNATVTVQVIEYKKKDVYMSVRVEGANVIIENVSTGFWKPDFLVGDSTKKFPSEGPNMIVQQHILQKLADAETIVKYEGNEPLYKTTVTIRLNLPMDGIPPTLAWLGTATEGLEKNTVIFERKSVLDIYLNPNELNSIRVSVFLNGVFLCCDGTGSDNVVVSMFNAFPANLTHERTIDSTWIQNNEGLAPSNVNVDTHMHVMQCTMEIQTQSHVLLAFMEKLSKNLPFRAKWNQQQQIPVKTSLAGPGLSLFNVNSKVPSYFNDLVDKDNFLKENSFALTHLSDTSVIERGFRKIFDSSDKEILHYFCQFDTATYTWEILNQFNVSKAYVTYFGAPDKWIGGNNNTMGALIDYQDRWQMIWWLQPTNENEFLEELCKRRCLTFQQVLEVVNPKSVKAVKKQIKTYVKNVHRGSYGEVTGIFNVYTVSFDGNRVPEKNPNEISHWTQEQQITRDEGESPPKEFWDGYPIYRHTSICPDLKGLNYFIGIADSVSGDMKDKLAAVRNALTYGPCVLADLFINAPKSTPIKSQCYTTVLLMIAILHHYTLEDCFIGISENHAIVVRQIGRKYHWWDPTPEATVTNPIKEPVVQDERARTLLLMESEIAELKEENRVLSQVDWHSEKLQLRGEIARLKEILQKERRERRVLPKASRLPEQNYRLRSKTQARHG